MTAASRGWGEPCTPRGQIVVLRRADGLKLPIRRQIAELVAMLIDLTELSGYDVVPGWTWGHACRKISGSNRWSNHAWSLAVDINAPTNPYASANWHRANARGTFPFGLRLYCDMPEGMISLWEDHGFRWGGRYQTKPDPMHFEFMGTPGDAEAHTASLRAWIDGQSSGDAPDTSQQTVEKHVFKVDKYVKQGDRGASVRTLQSLLVGKASARIRIDGDFGPATVAAVVAFQRFWATHDRSVVVDGIVGPQTWDLLAL